MSILDLSANFAATVLAAGLPLAAGLAVVIWSKVRAAGRQARVADMDARLRGLYRTVELREPPEQLAEVIEDLEGQEAVAAAAVAAAAIQHRARPTRQA